VACWQAASLLVMIACRDAGSGQSASTCHHDVVALFSSFSFFKGLGWWPCYAYGENVQCIGPAVNISLRSDHTKQAGKRCTDWRSYTYSQYSSVKRTCRSPQPLLAVHEVLLWPSCQWRTQCASAPLRTTGTVVDQHATFPPGTCHAFLHDCGKVCVSCTWIPDERAVHRTGRKSTTVYLKMHDPASMITC
jgi:hypothetical protein